MNKIEIDGKKQENVNNQNDNDEEVIDENEDDEDEINLTPKLTRSKARELNITPLKTKIPIKTPESEVAALIRGELRSDDEDEEYNPNEDDIHVSI